MLSLRFFLHEDICRRIEPHLGAGFMPKDEGEFAIDALNGALISHAWQTVRCGQYIVTSSNLIDVADDLGRSIKGKEIKIDFADSIASTVERLSFRVAHGGKYEHLPLWIESALDNYLAQLSDQPSRPTDASAERGSSVFLHYTHSHS